MRRSWRVVGKQLVMPGPVPGIHVFLIAAVTDVDGRDEPGHDDPERRALPALAGELF
jgi:hypothetical protein